MRNLPLVFAVGLALLASAPIAMAQPDGHAGHHGAAVQTTPADGAMGATPAAFSATFPHPMRLTSLVVTRRGGDPLAIDIPTATPATTASAPLPTLAPGNYTISWTAIGADNHVMNGAVRYMVH